MQTTLVSRIEKIWSMADIALKHGYVDYGVNGHSKVANVAGLRFKFVDDILVRVRSAKLDVSIAHLEAAKDVVFFPGTQTIVHFSQGCDDMLERCYQELLTLQNTFSPKRKAD